MSYKTVVSALAIALTFYAFYPHILGILRGAIKPHVFSWVIWGSTTFVVAFAQGEADGGAGAQGRDLWGNGEALRGSGGKAVFVRGRRGAGHS